MSKASYATIDPEDFTGPDPVRIEAHLLNAERLLSAAEQALDEHGLANVKTAASLASAHAAIALGWAHLSAVQKYEVYMPEECDEEQEIHVARDGERRCTCPAQVKIT